jgi:hypothetical protein
MYAPSTRLEWWRKRRKRRKRRKFRMLYSLKM